MDDHDVRSDTGTALGHVANGGNENFRPDLSVERQSLTLGMSIASLFYFHGVEVLTDKCASRAIARCEAQVALP
ncbi:MAG TPA: hypothetical protein VME40_11760 [Caulobacteraceae bacterium]|nr:hypothetical protein [Caulobacteraceae bacterium]